VRFAGSAPTLASALASSSSNVGIAVGSWVAGIALASPLGQAGPPLVGTVTAALTLVPLTALALMRATRSDDRAAAGALARVVEPGWGDEAALTAPRSETAERISP
jgi:DHA1 family inner membrane transport protein